MCGKVVCVCVSGLCVCVSKLCMGKLRVWVSCVCV